MSNRIASILAVAAIGASGVVLAQSPIPVHSPTDLTFTATGTRCKDVNWSQQTLAQFPRIAAACEAVVQRDGNYFVVFSGTVTRVAHEGSELTVDFKDGDEIMLNPPSDMKIDIHGRMTPVADVRAGTELKFYVPQERFVAEVPQGEAVSAPIPITQVAPEHLASAEQPAAELPQTGTNLGLLLLGGLALAGAGAGLTTARYRRGTR